MGIFENLLYSKRDNKVGSKTYEIIENLSFLSHYLQSTEERTMPAIVSGIAEKMMIDIETNFGQEVSQHDICCEPAVQYSLFSEFTHPIFKSKENPSFYFIDLFAGIGGFRIACQNNGGKCVFSSEWDADAQKTYFHNFGEYPFGDITLPRTKECIPDNFDLLCAGFPCQAFSIAGYRKGFEDTRGTLFFDVATIIKEKRPKAFILENVKNLVAHDEGRTFEVIYNTLTDLGYRVFYKVLNSMVHANIPQNRERIIIVGFDPEQVREYEKFSFPEKCELTKTIHDCIDYSNDDESLFYREDSKYFEYLKETMLDPDTVYQWRRQYVRENKSNVCPTLTANMGTGGHNVPLIITDNGFRKLTPKECLNFQGFPPTYEFPPIAKSKQYKQAGNSVTVPLIQAVVEKIITLL